MPTLADPANPITGSPDFIQSGDPRIYRLHLPLDEVSIPEKNKLDQLETWQVFIKTKESKPFEHVGIIHAGNADMAFLFGKEQYTRRGNEFCALAVVSTRNVVTTETFEKGENALQMPLPEYFMNMPETPGPQFYEVFYQKKRGKQHIHAGSVEALSFAGALEAAGESLASDPVVSVWLALRTDVQQTNPDEIEIWNTLPEKKYREVITYKAQDRINKFKAETANAGSAL